MSDEGTPKGSGSPSPALDVTIPADHIAADGREPLGPGITVGRYVLGEQLGSGGMGAVYRARDPDLDRELAIKVVLPDIAGRRSQERLLAEARAMAKLRHPNVLPVFDVGITERGVHVVMPLVTTGTLHDWLTETPRPWRDVVARFVAAGRGLAAAHAVGIVHRDFKPRNVLVDERGTVLVADFGLADASVPAGASGDDALASSVVGTPAYMAPEQAAGVAVDARADQYSFCISFWEGLHGRRPRADGEPAGDEPAPGDREAPPTWLQLAIARGFSREPDRRWPSIDTLLDEIETRGTRVDRSARRVPLWMVGGAGLLVAGGVAFAFSRSGATHTNRNAPPTEPAPAASLRLSAPRPLTTTHACAANPAFADASTVVFDLSRDDAVDLHAVTLDGTSSRVVLANPEWEWRSAPGRAPGEVFFLGTNTQELTRSYLAAVDVASGAVRDRIDVAATGVAAVGDAIYYGQLNGTELRVRRGATDELVRNYPRSSLAAFAIHAPTMRIAYTGFRPGPLCHHLLPSGTPVCTKQRLIAQRPVFSSQGDAIYVGSREAIERLDLTTGTESVVAPVDASGGVAISPDGRHIAFSSCGPRARIVDMTVVPEAPLLDEPNARSPAVGPDRALAWVRITRDARVLVVRTPDGKVRQLTSPGLGDVIDPVFDPTGRWIAFESMGSEPGVYIAALDESHPVITRMTDHKGDGRPKWLAADKLVFRRTDVDGVTRAFIVDTNGGEPVELPGRSRPPLAANPSRNEVLVVNMSGSGVAWWNATTRRERPGPKGAPPSIASGSTSPDGHWLLLQSGAAGGVFWRAELPDGDLEKVHEETGGRSIEQAAIDNDGHIVAAPTAWTGDLYVSDVEAGAF